MHKASKKKIVLFPILLMTVFVFTSGIAMDYALSLQLEKQLQTHLLKMTKAFAESLELLEKPVLEVAQEQVLRLAQLSNGRISIIRSDGVVLGDSEVSEGFLSSLDNHSNRPEIIDALSIGHGQAIRESVTLDIPMQYTAVRFTNAGTQLVLSLSFPLDDYYSMLWKSRWAMLFMGILIILGTTAVAFYAFWHWTKSLQKEHDKLEKRIEERTGHITQLQTMGALLSACETLDEIWQIVGKWVPRVLPKTSGGIALFCASRNQLENSINWGKGWNGEDYFNPKQCWALRKGALHQPGVDVDCTHWVPRPGFDTICIPMMAQGETLGVVQFSAPENYWGENAKGLATAIAEQTGLAVANHKLRETLRHQAIVDPLTGVFNRRFMQEAFSNEIMRATRHKLSVGLLVCDLDKFKKLNDRYGHDAGDAVLREFGMLLQRIVRSEDVACRYGGEEFVVVLPETDLEQAKEVAKRLCSETRALEIQFGGITIPPFTISIGVATYPLHGMDDATLFTAADKALYMAKKSGRDQYVVAAEVGSVAENSREGEG